jgi:subtilisin family serine protease
MGHRFRTAVLILLAGVVPISAQQATEIYEGKQVAANQVLVKLNNTSSAAVQQAMQAANAQSARPASVSTGIYVMHSNTANVPALMAALQGQSTVAYVEPDYIVKTTNTPNDPDFSQQWALLNLAVPGADISATQAWNISTGSAANVVAVADTGLDYTHSDLAANVWSAPAPFTVTLGWGQLSCPAGSHGYNSITHSCDPMDDNAHGTHVSGTIGALGNNAVGVAGVNWTTSIMGLKFLDSSGTGTVSDAIDAIDFAIQLKTQFAGTATPVNVRVLSNSWSGAGYSQALLDEINKANSSEMLFVAAAGNSSSSLDLFPTYPASYVAPNMVTVAATTNTDSLASFSNFGALSVHLGAPGVNILSTLPNNSYGYYSGTSMATPHVSGAAMLVLSKCTLNTAALKNVLLGNTDPDPGLLGITITGGRLNVNKAIQSCAPALPVSTGTASFLKTDTTTEGSWEGAYGGDGYSVIGDSSSTPAYVTVTPSGNSAWTWSASTGDPRAMQTPSTPGNRIASCWYSGGSFTVDLNFHDGNAHQVAFYALDWDNGGWRSQRLDILDGNNNLLDSRTATSFAAGKYWVWNLSGHVILRVTNTGSPNAVLSGILFGAGGATPSSSTGATTFTRVDSLTQGSWMGMYGADGYNVINDAASTPAYVAVTPIGISPWTWTAFTSDVRAMQNPVVPGGRIASCWYSSSSFTVAFKFNDANVHQVALYFLDWDNQSRSERVDILDANGNVTDTRAVSNFKGGQYWVWQLSGSVQVRVTNTGPVNAVLNGIFFR